MTRGGAALTAIGLVLALVACYVVMVLTAAGQAADLTAFRLVFGVVPAGWPALLVTGLARGAAIVVLAGTAVVLGVAAVARRAWRALLASVVTVGVSVMLGVWLRDDVLVRGRFTDEAFPQNSMPSTHAVAAAALVVAILLLWPEPRPWWLAHAPDHRHGRLLG